MSDQPQLQQTQERIRVPLYGTEHAGPFTTDGQFHVNLIPGAEKDPITGQQQWFLEKRQGIQMKGVAINFAAKLSSTSGSVGKDLLCMTQFDGVIVYAVYDNGDSTIKIFAYNFAADTFTTLGSISGANQKDFVHLTEIKDNALLSFTSSLAVVWTKYDLSTSKGFYAQSVSGAFVAGLNEITDTDFPTKLSTPEVLTGPFVQMNGTTYCMTTAGKIYNCDLLDITSWNSLGVIQAVAYPDQGIGLCRYKHHIIALGKDSVEFFNDVGNPVPASPLERTEQAFIKFGCAGQYLYKNIDDTLWWVATSTSAGGGGLYKLEGYTPVRVSTPRQTQRIAVGIDLMTVNNKLSFCRLQPFICNGKRQIMLSGILKTVGNIGAAIVGTNLASVLKVVSPMVYCPEYDTWWYYANNDSQDSTQNDSFIACAIVQNSQYRINSQLILRTPIDSSSSTSTYTGIYLMGSSSATSDNSSGSSTLPIVCAVILQQMDFGNEQRKFIRRATIHALPFSGSGIYDLVIAAKKDGTWFIRNLSPANQGSTRFYLNNFGAARKILWCIAWADTGSNVVLRDFELTVAQGTA